MHLAMEQEMPTDVEDIAELEVLVVRALSSEVLSTVRLLKSQCVSDLKWAIERTAWISHCKQSLFYHGTHTPHFGCKLRGTPLLVLGK